MYDTHLTEGDMEMQVEVDARMGDRLRAAEQWRLAKQAQGADRAPGLSLGGVLGRVATTVRQALGTPPAPRRSPAEAVQSERR